MPITSYSQDQMRAEMERVFQGNLSLAAVRLRFTSDYVGGQPAMKKGVEGFVHHHLGLTGDEAENAVARILGEEVRIDKPGDEVQEKISYALNVIRRNEAGIAYLGTWQLRAMIKQSASRLGLFVAKGKMGSKGDLSEAMLIKPDGPSDIGHHQQIGFCQPTEDEAGSDEMFKERIFQRFNGSVSTPKGRTSIQHDSEIAPTGCELHATIEWPSKKISGPDMAAILSLGQRIGLGSVKSLEHGRFFVMSLSIQTPDKPKKDEKK